MKIKDPRVKVGAVLAALLSLALLVGTGVVGGHSTSPTHKPIATDQVAPPTALKPPQVDAVVARNNVRVIPNVADANVNVSERRAWHVLLGFAQLPASHETYLVTTDTTGRAHAGTFALATARNKPPISEGTDPIGIKHPAKLECWLRRNGHPTLDRRTQSTHLCSVSLSERTPVTRGAYVEIKAPSGKVSYMPIARHSHAVKSLRSIGWVTASNTTAVNTTAASSKSAAHHTVWCNTRRGSPFPGRHHHGVCRLVFVRVHLREGTTFGGARVNGAPLGLRPTAQLVKNYKRIVVKGGSAMTCHWNSGRLKVGPGLTPLVCIFGVRVGNDGRTVIYFEHNGSVSWFKVVQLSRRSIRALVRIPWPHLKQSHQVVAA